MSSPREPTHDHNTNAPLITEILSLLAKVSARFSAEENEEWQWIAKRSHNPLVVEMLRDSTITAMHVIDVIGRLEPVNGITVAEQSHIPRGTVSKVTRRLLSKNLLRTESLPNNKKEILFRLTPLGRELFQVHRAFDEQMEKGFVQFLQRYSEDELQFLVRLLHDAMQTSFLTPE